jgi:transposase
VAVPGNRRGVGPAQVAQAAPAVRRRVAVEDFFPAPGHGDADPVTDEGKQLSRRRAGVEGTLSQGVRAFGLRRSRYLGLAKTHLQHVITAGAMNLARLAAWFTGDPPEETRTSRFARLRMAG